MNLKLIGTVSFLVLFGNQVSASDIDKKLKLCINANQTTAGMINCTNQALLKWDRELNRIYKELQRILDEEAKSSLRNSQRKWITYKEAEIQSVNTIYSSLQGTMYIPMRANAILQITKKRTLELKSYLALVSK